MQTDLAPDLIPPVNKRTFLQTKKERAGPFPPFVSGIYMFRI